MRKYMSKDLKKQYNLLIKTSLITTLILFIMIFVLAPSFSRSQLHIKKMNSITELTNIPQMEKYSEPKEVKIKVNKRIVEIANNMQESKYDSFVNSFDEELVIDNKSKVYETYETRPEIIQNAIPEYPEICKKLGIEGIVTLKLLIEKDGTVSNVVIIKGIHELLDQAALNAAYQMKFSPAMTRDISLRAYLILPVRFILSK